MVLERDDNRALNGVLTADSADYDTAAGGWRLLRGIRIKRDTTATEVFGPDEGMRKEPVEFYGSDLDPEEIMLRQSAQWLEFLSLRQLHELRRRNVVSADRVAQIRHTRFTTPINSMVLLVLGIVFFLHREPASVVVQGGKALAVCAACFVISFIGQNLVGAIDLSPALPAWLPTILFAPVCAVLVDGIRT
jgi:lipopolysaccharide export LptBFGC system permease protein LptF